MMSPWFKKWLKSIGVLYVIFFVVCMIPGDYSIWMAGILGILFVIKIIQFVIYAWKSFWGWRVVIYYK